MVKPVNLLLTRFMDTKLVSNVVRMHVSHSDLDGIGCVSLRKLATKADPDSGYYVHTKYVDRPADVNTNILQWVDEMVQSGTIRFCTELQILITDLSGVDLSLFNQIEQKYGMLQITVIGIVIDHHVHSADERVVANFINASLTSGGWPKFNVAIDYTTVPGTSSTKQVAEYLYSYYDGQCEFALHYADAVSKYDTGNWGDWECEYYSDVDLSVKLQLCFNELSTAYKKATDPLNLEVSIPALVEEFFTKCLHQGIVPCSAAYVDPSSNDFGIAEGDSALWGLPFGSKEFRNLSVMNEKFLNNLKDVIGGMQIPGDQEYPQLLSKYPILANIGKVYFIRTTDDRLSYFSLISRKYFEDHPDVHALILWDRLRHEAGFRSDGKIDVSEIARAFGGGGHVKASGYPLHASSIVTL